MATPGLATRGNEDGSHDILRKFEESPPPKRRSAIEKPWKRNMLDASSPLDQLAVVSSPEEVASPDQDFSTPSSTTRPALARAETPSDQQYLGSFQPGSLMITNGSASPAPSIAPKRSARKLSTADTTLEEDYFTASEGRISEELHRTPVDLESGEPPLPTPWPTVMTGTRHNASEGEPRKSRTQERTRASSPLKRQLHIETSNVEETPIRDQVAVKHTPTEDQPSTGNCEIRRTATFFARTYSVDIPDSPFSTDPPKVAETPESRFSQTFQLPDPSPGSSLSSSSQSTPDFRAEAFKILDGRGLSVTAVELDVTPPISRSGSARMDKAANPVSTRPVPKKADSGYSLTASLRIRQRVERSQDSERRQSEPRSEASNSADRSAPARLYSFEEMLEKELPATPQQTVEASLPEEKVEEKVEPTAATKSRSRSKSLKRFSRPSFFSSPSSTTVESQATSTVASPVSEKNTPTKPKKLQKRRQPKDLPVMQEARALDAGEIPSVPDSVVQNFSHRIVSNPGMDHLQRTFASVDHEDSVKDAKDDGVYDIPVKFPSTGRTPPPRSKSETNLRGLAEELAPAPPQHRYIPRLPFFGKKSAEPQQRASDEPHFGVSDFGTVAQSLGGSPYDIAMSANQNKIVSTRPTHRAGLSTNTSRPKSMVEMDSATAAEFAKQRSRDRQAAEAASGARPSLGVRPRSFHANPPASSIQVTDSRPKYEALRGPAPPMPTAHSKPQEALAGSGRARTAGQFRSRAPPTNPTGNQVKGEDASSTVSSQPRPQPRSRKSSHHESDFQQGFRDGSEQEHTAEKEVVGPPERVSTERRPSYHYEDYVQAFRDGSEHEHVEEKQALTPDVDSKWAVQANIWRERRKSMGEQLRKDKGVSTPSNDYPKASPLRAHPISAKPEVEQVEEEPAPPPVPMHRSSFQSQGARGSPREFPLIGRNKPVAPPLTESASYDSFTTALDSNSPTPRPQTRDSRIPSSVLDRYGGGLEFAYEAKVGVGGAAGTRHLRTQASRKSMPFSNQFGVDLSDVPVIVQRAR